MGDIILVGIHILTWGTEFFVFLLCIHGIYGQKIRINLSIIAMDVIANIILGMIYAGIMPVIFTGIIYVMIFFYMRKISQKNLLESIGKCILSIIVVGVLEVFSTYSLILLEKYLRQQELHILIINAIAFCLSIIFYHITVKNRKINHVFQNKKFLIVILICGLGMLFLLLDYRRQGRMEQLYYLAFMGLMIAVYFYWNKTQKIQFELEKKKIELEMQNIYGKAYQDLLNEVRRRQHDFMNQLTAIYSMHLTATSLEDLIEKQSRYGGFLKEQGQYDKILTGCNNPILAGYLYYKCLNFEERNIAVSYNIHTDTAECSLAIHELIEILGIFLTNALEANESNEASKRIVDLVVVENGDGLFIEVGNPSPYITADKVEEMFQEGSSSKGDNRGIGLARIKQIIDKCRAEIIVENSLKSEINWVAFKLVIPN